MTRKQLLFTMLVCLYMGVASGQGIIYVNNDATGSNDGTSWENAYTNLSQAIAVSRSGDMVWVAAGVYYPTSQPNYPVGSANERFNHFSLKNGVQVIGGFAGDETSVEQRDLVANKSVLSADIDQNDNVEPEGYVLDYTKVVGSNVLKLFYFPEGSTIDTTAVLDGFILSGAVADNDVFPYMGGAAFLCQGASPKVVNCGFYGNYCKADGGAIWINQSSMIIDNCTFSGNYAALHAGAVNFNNTSATLKGCTFSNNKAKWGGAVNIEGGSNTSIISNCSFSGNIATDNGGALVVANATVLMKNTALTNNKANGGYGGAIAFYNHCNVEAVNCTMNGNNAANLGGAIGADYYCNFILTNCKIQGNISGYYGGGISLARYNTMKTYNCLFSGNKCGDGTNGGGAALYNYSGSVTNIYNNTITANLSSVTNPAAILCADAGSKVNIYNSIVNWNNASNSSNDEYLVTNSGVINFYNSDSYGLSSTNGNESVNPLFLTNPSAIIKPSTAGDFSLWGNSPVNNKGNNTYLPKDTYDLDGDGNTTEVIAYDINGKPRVFAGVCDMGCFEQQFETASGNYLLVRDAQNVTMGSGINLSNTDFSIEFWIKPETDGIPGHQNICGNDDNGVVNRSPMLYIFQNDRIHYGYGDGVNWNAGDTEKALKPGQWNHVAMTFNNATNKMTLYANGKKLEELIGVGEVLSTTSLKYINTNNLLRAGLDEFRVWKEERTLAQLTANMGKTLTGNETNLALYYSFDQVTSGDIEDQAGSYNGTTVNTPGMYNSSAILTPVIIGSSNVGMDNFTISWNAIQNAKEYVIDVATDEAFQNTVLSNQSAGIATTYTVNNLSKGTVYYYKVTSINALNQKGSQYAYVATKMTPPGNAFAFDGATYIDATDVCKYDLTGGTTVECWIKTQNLYQSIWACNNSAGKNNYILFSQTDGHLLVAQQLPDGTVRDLHFSNAAILQAGWNHVAVTIGGDANHTVSIYLNGVLKGTGVGVASPFPYGSKLSLGQEWDGTTPSDFYTGQMDEFRVWNKVLTLDEIQANMNKTLLGTESGLVSYYDFDLQTGLKVIDKANVFDGTVVGNVSWVPSTVINADFKAIASAQTISGFTLNWNTVSGATGYTVDVATDNQFENKVINAAVSTDTNYVATGLDEGSKYFYRVNASNGSVSIVDYTTTKMNVPGNALSLDGQKDFIEANQLAEQGNKNQATMECWAWVDPTETRAAILSINTANGGNKYLLSYQTGNGYYLYLENGGTKKYISSNDERKGAWVHLAVTMNDATFTSFYLNGKLVGTETGGSAPLFTGNQISFGQEFDGTNTTDFFKGALDEVRFWSTIRTQTQIQASMYSKLDGTETGLMAYYDFDQTEGQFVYERKNGLDATVVGTPQWVRSEALITPLVSSITNITPSSVTLNWFAVTGATDYKMDVAADVNFSNIVKTIVSTGNVATYNITGLNQNTDYFIRLASLTNRWSGWGLTENVSTLLVPPGNALKFNGKDDQVNLGAIQTSDWSTMTAEAWVKVDRTQTIDWPYIVGNFDRTSKTGFAMLLKSYSNELKFQMWDQAHITQEVVGTIPINDEQWHHVAATFTGTSLILYLDGRLHNQFNIGSTKQISKGLIDCVIGNNYDGYSWRILNGSIDEVRIWTIARSEAQINEYAHKSLIGNEAGLLAYYNLDKANGTTFTNAVSANYNGTMVGTVEWAESKALITPFTLPATNITNNGFTANWEAIPAATKYYIRVASDALLTQPLEGWEKVDVGNDTTFNLTGLTENTVYYFGAMSLTDRESAWSPASAMVTTTGSALGELAANLSGTSGYIDLSAHIAKISGKNAGAITGWFKTATKGLIYSLKSDANNYAYIKVGDVNGTYADESFSFWLRKDGALNLWMIVRKGENYYTDNQWHHFAVITGDGNNRILIDGMEQEVYFNSGNAQSQVFSTITNASSILIGESLTGSIDELAIYKNPITNEEAIDRMHRKLDGTEIGLISYYSFNDKTVNDHSGYGRNGAVVGAVSYQKAVVLSVPVLNSPVPGVASTVLSWQAINKATEYILEVAADVNFQNKVVDYLSLTTTQYSVNLLNKNTKYYFRVKAKVTGAWSEFSGAMSFFSLPGKSLVLDGVDDYVTCDGISNYPSDEATVECWVKPASGGNRYAVWAQNSANAAVNQYILFYFPADKKLQISTMDADGTSFKVYDFLNIDLSDTWHHVAVCIIKNGSSKVYVDGKQKGSFTHHLAPIISGYLFSIGQEWDQSGATIASSDFYKGEMDEFRVWNMALTQDQVRANMNLSEPEGANEHYIAHYTFDELHSGTTIKDLAKQNDATLVKGPTIINSEGVIIPITLEANNATPGSFNLHINNIASAKSFEIEVAYDATFVPPLAVHENIGRTLDYTVNSLCPGVKYYYRARAIYDAGTISAWSIPDTISTISQNAVISNFSATQGDYSQKLKLSWECSYDYLITDFEIKRRIAGELSFELLAKIPNNGGLYQFTDTLAMPGTYYEYTIQGLSYCYGNNTQVVNSNIGYNIPALVASREINAETHKAYIRLDWQYHPDFCNNVEIVRTNTETGIVQVFQEVADSLVYRDEEVELCVPYNYQLTAKTTAFGDVKSRATVFTLREDIFAAIDTLDASKGYFDSKIVLNWVSEKQNIIDQYQISRRKYARNAEWQVVKIIDKGTTQVWIDEDAIAGEYYQYLIVGIGTCGSDALYTDSVTSVGFRQPEGTIAGQISYQGGNPVGNVKLTVNYDDANLTTGNCLSFDGTDSLKISQLKNFNFSNGQTVEMWVRPNNLNTAYVLFKNKGLVFDYENSGEFTAISGSAMVSYNIKTNILHAWENNAWNHVAVSVFPDSIKLLINGKKMAVCNASTLLAFDATLVGLGFEGYLEELRIWNIARTDSLIDRYKGLMLGRETTGMICNLRFDEALGNFVFDHSRTDDEPNKSHATIYGAQWSGNVPSTAKLSLGAKSELNGNYMAKGIWFKGSGDSYRITPSFGVHQFDPSNRALLISQNSLVHSNQNFTDISSFVVTGNVKYHGSDFPVDGVMLTIDGQLCVNAEGAPVVTDQYGNFSIEVPIGRHFISTQKINHLFSQGYFPPKKPNGDVDYFLFDNPVSGIQFIDSTYLTVAGRIVGGTVEGDKEIGFGKSKNNLGVCSFTLAALKGYPINGTQNTITVNTNTQSGEYVVKLYPEQFQFVIDAAHHIGNDDFTFNTIDDLAVINLSNPLLENTVTDTIRLVEINQQDTTSRDSIATFKYHLKRNWIYRSVPSIEVLSKNNNAYFYDSIIQVQDASQDTISFTLINADGSNRLAFPVFRKGAFYSTKINVFEEYVNADNGITDRVPVQDGKLVVINGCATYPAPVEYTIKNGQLEYDFVGGFPNPTIDNTNPELSYTKTFEVHSYTGAGGAMHSQWPQSGAFRAYVFGGIPTGQNFVTQGPDQVDFILRDPPGSNSHAYFEKGFTVSSSVSNSFENSASMSNSLEIDLGWEVTTFVGFGAGIINTNEQVANAEAGVGFESVYSGGHSREQSTTFTQSYSTSDDPLYVGEPGDIFFGHSTNITYGVSNCIGILPVGTGETELNSNVDGFTIGLNKGLNLGLKFGTSFIFSQNHIENYLIPDLEMFYQKLLSEGNPDSANFYLQQANLWRKTLAENEFQKYKAIKMKNVFSENKNISFDAGSVYEESMQSEVTETRTSSFEFSINSTVSTELGFEVMGMGSTWKMETEVGHSSSSENQNSETHNTTVGYVLNDGDQGDYFSVDILKCPFGNGPVFSTLGGQSACPYEGGTKVEYASYLGQNAPSDFTNDFQLNYPTMRIEVPKISAVNAIMAGVPDNEPAVFTLKLSNQSEINASSWFTLELDGSSNPYGAKVRMDGAAIVNGISILVPGGTTLTKTLEIEKGQNSVNNYENIRLVLHSQCQFDPTDDQEDIADTVSLTANFVPTCTKVAILNPFDNWIMNVEARDTMPVKMGGYNINHGTFEKLAFQFKADAAASWNTVAMFFNDTTNYAGYSGEKYKINGASILNYKWNMVPLQDKTYQIRAVTMCTDGSVNSSQPLTGVLDGRRPEVFGTPSPADGILSPNDEIMITFNEPIEEGAVSYYNIDVEGVLNGAVLNHGTSVEFDGNNDYVITPEGINLSGSSFTVEFWMQNLPGTQGTIMSTGHNGQGKFSFGLTEDSVFVVMDNQYFAAINNFNNGNWHHWSVMYNQANQMLTVYTDDQLIMEQPANSITAVGPVYFGKSCFGQASWFAGSLHDARIWRKSLSFNELVEQMNIALSGNEPGLIGYWPMDEAAGNLLTDKARSRHATMFAEWNVQPGGSAYAFNGTNQALGFGTSAIPVNNEMDFSIELWFKGGFQSQNAYLFSNGNTETETCPANRTLNVYLNTLGQIVVENNGRTMQTSARFDDNNWHHFAFVLNRRAYANIFVDGEKLNTLIATEIGSMQSAFAYIGARGYIDNFMTQHFDGYFNGSVDEVRIWNQARKQEQIKMYKNNRLNGSEIGLLAYFPFEKYEEMMGVLVSVPTLDDQSVDSNSETGQNHCGALLVYGNEGFINATPNIRRARPKSKVNFDFVINNDKIIVTPSDPLSMIERCILEITVRNIDDKHANRMASPVSWTAYVEKNQVRWGQDGFNFMNEISQPLNFQTSVVNLGGVEQSFLITNLPVWLNATPNSGSLAPNSETTISFSVNEGLNIGRYCEEIFLESTSGYAEKLKLDLNIYKQAPLWVVNETNFNSSMNIIAQLKIKGVFSTDVNDMLGVFAGNECRGVAKLQYKPAYDDYFAFLVVYGNISGETLTYKVWDASKGKVFSDVSPVYNFVPNMIYGSMANPVVFEVSELVDNTLAFSAGWNWISFNLGMNNSSVAHIFNSMELSGGDIIKHADLFSTYDIAAGNWFGSLQQIEIGKQYLFKSLYGGSLTYLGSPVNAADYPIQLVFGWNRIGYVPQLNLTVNEALSGFEPQVNDLIKSQFQFAMWDGYEWIGSLNYMMPGKGYMYKSNNTDTVSFVYPQASVMQKTDVLPQLSIPLAQMEQAALLGEFSMNVIAKLNSPMELQNARVEAYIHGRLAGVAEILDYNAYKSLCFITISANSQDFGSNIRFKLVQGSETCDISTSIIFENNALEGSLENPLVLNLVNPLSIEGLHVCNSYLAFPNPFTKKIEILVQNNSSELPEVYVLNTFGVRVADLEMVKMPDEGFKAIWGGTANNGLNSAEGIYFVVIKTQHETKVIQIVKSN